MSIAPDTQIESVVLAWLVTRKKAVTTTELKNSIGSSFDGGPSAAERAIAAATKRLETAGLLKFATRRAVTLTDEGHRKALEILRIPELPKRKNVGWDWVKKLLLLRELDLPVTPAMLRDIGKDDAIPTALLARHHGVELRNDIDLPSVATTIGWRILGLDPIGKLKGLPALLALLLPRLPAPTTTAPAATNNGADDIETFARKVNDVARQSPTGRWHDNKVFISHVWEAYRRTHHTNGMSYTDFQRKLVEAHRARLIRLGRADLVEAMPYSDVEASETPYLNATFHFIRLDEG